MRRVTVREMRGLLPGIEATLRDEGGLVLTRRGRPVARVLPVVDLDAASTRFSTRALRARMTPLAVPGEVLLRQERDER